MLARSFMCAFGTRSGLHLCHANKTTQKPTLQFQRGSAPRELVKLLRLVQLFPQAMPRALAKWVCQNRPPRNGWGGGVLWLPSKIFCPGIWLWVKNRYPKRNPAKWKQGLKPAVPCWFNFDPYPYPA